MDTVFDELRRNGRCYALGIVSLIIGHSLSLPNPLADDFKNVAVAVVMFAAGINAILTLREDARQSLLDEQRQERCDVARILGRVQPRFFAAEKAVLVTRGGGQVDLARANRHLSLGLAMVIIGLAVLARGHLQGRADTFNDFAGYCLLGFGSCINTWAFRWWRNINRRQRISDVAGLGAELPPR